MDSDNRPASGAGQTLEDIIREGAARFEAAGLHYGHGTDNALDEALMIAAHVASLPVLPTHDVLQSLPSDDVRREILALYERRIQERIPAAYLIHTAWFAGLSFYVDERVLVPRSPIAELIEEQFQPWIDAGRVRRILDLCTGSGCIAIACAVAFPDAAVDATDISPEALEVAAVNVTRHGLQDRVRLIRSDLFDAVPHGHYDLIISNPPYVPRPVVAKLPQEYTHEPELGLAAGDAGLDIVMRILADAPDYLAADGMLIVEVGISQDSLEQACPQLPFTWLEFEHGGEGVFLLDAKALREYQP
jgi:ribosomal protein L3 glutamine methyltransferase